MTLGPKTQDMNIHVLRFSLSICADNVAGTRLYILFLKIKIFKIANILRCSAGRGKFEARIFHNRTAFLLQVANKGIRQVQNTLDDLFGRVGHPLCQGHIGEVAAVEKLEKNQLFFPMFCT